MTHNSIDELVKKNKEVVDQAAVYYERISAKLAGYESLIRESGCLAPVELQVDDLPVVVMKIGGVWRLAIKDANGGTALVTDRPVAERVLVIREFTQVLQAILESNTRVIQQLRRAAESL